VRAVVERFLAACPSIVLLLCPSSFGAPCEGVKLMPGSRLCAIIVLKEGSKGIEQG
jgi:hypothetical protein